MRSVCAISGYPTQAKLGWGTHTPTQAKLGWGTQIKVEGYR
jgi:hypothetical protein